MKSSKGKSLASKYMYMYREVCQFIFCTCLFGSRDLASTRRALRRSSRSSSEAASSQRRSTSTCRGSNISLQSCQLRNKFFVYF